MILIHGPLVQLRRIRSDSASSQKLSAITYESSNCAIRSALKPSAMEADAVASEDELVGACQLVFVKVNYVFKNLAAMEIDRLSVNGMRVKPLMKVTCTVTNNNDVEALLLKIVGKHHPKVIVSCRAFHSGWTATVIVGINGNATTMDIDEPIFTFGVADIVVGGLFAIAAKCVR